MKKHKTPEQLVTWMQLKSEFPDAQDIYFPHGGEGFFAKIDSTRLYTNVAYQGRGLTTLIRTVHIANLLSYFGDDMRIKVLVNLGYPLEYEDELLIPPRTTPCVKGLRGTVCKLGKEDEVEVLKEGISDIDSDLRSLEDDIDSTEKSYEVAVDNLHKVMEEIQELMDNPCETKEEIQEVLEDLVNTYTWRGFVQG